MKKMEYFHYPHNFSININKHMKFEEDEDKELTVENDDIKDYGGYIYKDKENTKVSKEPHKS